jgi:putative endonuclease
MYYTYILKSEKDKRLYIGYTSDLKKRFFQHNNGEVTATKNRRPLKLIYYQAFLSETDARREERYLKSGGKANNDLKLKLKDSLIIC